jgi:hypothetical protein
MSVALLAFARAQVPVPAQLSGRVIAADNDAPVRSASIRLVAAKADVGTIIAISDDEGRFELAGVMAGQYSLQVSKPGFVSTAHGLTPDAPGPFGVSAGQRISVGDLRLPRAGAIAGRVSDAFGDAVADITVTAWYLEFLTPALRRVVSTRSFQSNDLGEFRIYGLRAGKYYVSAALKGGALEAPTFYPGVASLADAQPIEVRSGQDSPGITMQVASMPYGVVTGMVTDSKGAPYTAAQARLVSARTGDVLVNTAQLGANTDTEGRFRIVNVSPGEYRLEVFSKSWLEKLGKEGTIVDAVSAGEVATVPVSLVSGETVELVVRASPGYRVRGQVFIDGTPMKGTADARITAMPVTNALSAAAIPSSSVVAPDGTFMLQGVRGQRLIGPQGPIAGAFFHHTLVGGIDVAERAVEVTGDVTGVEVHLTTRPARLEGAVHDGSGSPVRDARLVVFSTNRGDWLLPGNRRYYAITVTGEGTFRLSSIPAGNYLAAVVPREDSGRWADPDYLDNLRATATPFTASDGSTSTVRLVVKR